MLDREPDETFRSPGWCSTATSASLRWRPSSSALVSDAWAARAAAGIAIASWRSAEGLEDPEFAERDLARLHAVLRHLIDTGFDESARTCRGPARDTAA